MSTTPATKDGLGIQLHGRQYNIRTNSIPFNRSARRSSSIYSSSVYSATPSVDRYSYNKGRPSFDFSSPIVPETPAQAAKRLQKLRASLPFDMDSEDLIDSEKLLEETLDIIQREQAVTFVRKSSSTPRVGSSRFPGSATFKNFSPPDDYEYSYRDRVQNNNISTGSPRPHRSYTLTGTEASRIVHSESDPEVLGGSEQHYRSLSNPGLGLSLSPNRNNTHSFSSPSNSPLTTLPRTPIITKRIRVPSQIFPFVTRQEDQETAEKVYSKIHGCERHENCTDCTNTDFAYWENLIMSTSIPADERQKIIANNKSLRTIKNELETLLENGLISDEAYDTFISSLPAETSLNAAARRNVAPASSSPANPTTTSDTNPLTAAISNMRINSNNSAASHEPPSYTSSTATPPALPGRTPSQAPDRPEIGRATALYPYVGAPEDCSFGVGETLVIYEYMNQEWCYGKNLTTSQQGLFPTNYVQIAPQPQPPTPNPNAYGSYGAEKQNGYGAGYPGQYLQSQGPPPPGQSNPYNAAVPPMAVAEQPANGQPSKGSEMGKKFGKKLGNAAIFGAGATIGGNIVNSIF